MKKLSLFFILFSIISFGLKSQVLHEVYRDSKTKILEFDRYKWYNLLDNLDGDDLWFSTRDTNNPIIHIDKDLNILYSSDSPNKIYRTSKSNNKLYGVKIKDSVDYDLNYYYIEYLDTYCEDTLGNILFSKRIMNESDDTLQWRYWKEIILENKDRIFALLNTSPEYISSSDPIIAMKLIRIDSLGNVAQTKIHYRVINEVDIANFDNQHFLLSKQESWLSNENYLYYVNTNTLEIEDSIGGYDAYNMKKLNDSIFTFSHISNISYNFPDYSFSSFFNSFYLMNKNTKIGYPILSYCDPIYDSIWHLTNRMYSGANNVDFITTDSIYSCFSMHKHWMEYYGQNLGFGIVNYNIIGDTNFVYRIYNGYSNILGLKATSDGGVILLFGNSLVKFMPNGLASILDIETKEKETIKVYPNPAKEILYIDIDCKNFTKSEIELFDMQGKLVKKSKLNSKKENRINVSNLNSGAYNYNVSLNGKTISGKIIIGK
ncbi:MAG: T9SS type A sorting domain-containing protein [Bacteroidales bacterium]|nr:T9SS type A sorting domain-containing protein [Bacteroidales bacterium]MDD4829403.1 T9SS type A sorting domain-containing protein [Bacteroidales bacterium]